MTPARQHSQPDAIPSIIIHPSLYKPERRFALQRLCEGFIELTRIALIVTLVGTATAGVAHMIQGRAHSARGVTPGIARDCARSALASESQQAANDAIIASSLLGASRDPKAPAQERARGHGVPLTPKPTKRAFDLSQSVRHARRMFALNRLEEAELAYRKVLAASDRQLAALVGLARVLLARGQHAEAQVLAQRAVEQAPDKVASQLTLGDVLRARGDGAASAAHYQLAALASLRDARAHAAPAAQPL